MVFSPDALPDLPADFDEGAAYAERLAAAEVEVRHTRYPGLIHRFIAMGAQVEAAAQALDEAGAARKELIEA